MNHELKDKKKIAGTLFIKDVDRIDCAIFNPAQGIFGQSWFVDVKISGTLDTDGFVYDFSKLKALIKQVLRTSIDHSLLIPVMSRHVQYQETEDGEMWTLNAKSDLSGLNGKWEYRCPKGAVFPIHAVTITRELVERKCTQLIRHRLPEYIFSVETHLRLEDDREEATFFHYTHAIPGHKGLCQRPFHGHRSLLEVYVDEKKRKDLETYIIDELLGSMVHIATHSQVVDKANFSGGKLNEDAVKLAFVGSMGRYEASIPSNRLFFVNPKTSIEAIARHLVELLEKKEKLGSKIRVACYEGIGKGAVADNY